MGAIGTTQLGPSGSVATLVNPDYEPVGTMHQLANGSIAYDSITTRWRFTLSWNAITEAQRNAIETGYLEKGQQTFSPPDSATDYTVLVVPNSFQDSYLEDGGGTRRYYCALALEEVS
jgi:hypothetical protein